MFDCAYQPEPEPKPTAIPRPASDTSMWVVATLLMLGIWAAAVLGVLAADYVMS